MSCTTCKHGQFERTATGRPKRNIPGRCTFEPQHVLSIVMVVQVRRTAIWPDMGDDCPTYTPATSASDAPRGTEEQLHGMLADLRQDYERRIAPIVKALAHAAAMSPVPPTLISVEQANALGLLDRPAATGNES